jgi:putative transcriptional regulator
MEKMKRKDLYRYTESGLDNVYLANGFEFGNDGTVIIRDIDGLQTAIGRALATQQRRLTGEEFRFLRTELLFSQASLAKVLGVKELTIGRWERGESEIPVSTEATVRTMFLESLGERKRMKELLEEIADLDDEIDRQSLKMRESKGHWAALKPESRAA